MAVCGSKKFSNKRVNFSQVTPYPSPTTNQLFLLHSHDEIIMKGVKYLVVGDG